MKTRQIARRGAEMSRTIAQTPVPQFQRISLNFISDLPFVLSVPGQVIVLIVIERIADQQPAELAESQRRI
jgi:hypothetical protein